MLLMHEVGRRVSSQSKMITVLHSRWSLSIPGRGLPQSEPDAALSESAVVLHSLGERSRRTSFASDGTDFRENPTALARALSIGLIDAKESSDKAAGVEETNDIDEDIIVLSG